MPLSVIVFNVQHGFCAFVKTPTNHALMIDCGKSETFSPVQYIATNQLQAITPHGSCSLTGLVVSHPHDDHVQDIESIKTKLPPAILYRQRYEWDDIKNSSAGDYQNLDSYSKWQATYIPGATEPDWGMGFSRFRLSPDEARKVDEAKYVNNSSIVVLLSWTIPGGVTWKFLFGGDMEEAGWSKLLSTNKEFRSAIGEVDFYMTSHHGHTSGFSAELFAAMGRPLVNVVSAKEGDESVDSNYSKEDYASGVEVGGTTRRMLSTRNDGSIRIHVSDRGCGIDCARFPDNIKEGTAPRGFGALPRRW